MTETTEAVDLAVVGSGAAGLMAAIQAAREAKQLGAKMSIAALDSARHLGAKILVAGGGRCNVTHDVVEVDAFAGSTPPAIRNVLRRFDVDATRAFFGELGVALKREEGGKLFPVTDRSRTVLDALVRACRDEGVRLVHPWRVESIERGDDRFTIRGPQGVLRARRLILATGGKALPKSGSDGHGLEIARRLGHTTTARIIPALVPIVLHERSILRTLAGIAASAAIEVQSSTGARRARFEGAILCTHFGVSGPAVLDVSRYWTHARLDDPDARLVVNWLHDFDSTGLIGELERHGGPPGPWLRARLPARLADALCGEAGIDPSAPIERASREVRRTLGETLCAYRLPAIGDRGFTHAEVTAGGVPLAETRRESLESRVCPGLHLVGEILDVDGRIGGYNFQWAWASGFVAGVAAARALAQPVASRSGGQTPPASR